MQKRSIMAISNKVGPPVTGEDFYGRHTELHKAHAYLDTNHSLVLSAPRRIGKSSFAKKLIEEKKSQGWKCVYIDLEGIQTQDEFLKLLVDKFNSSKIWTQAAVAAEGFTDRLMSGIKEIGPFKLDFSKPEISKSLFITLAESIDHKKDTLVVMDELPLFLNIIDKEDQDHSKAGFLLNWFRSLRQVSSSNIRWIFCGSVGLHNFTSMRNLSMTINDMISFDFDALSLLEARGLIQALSESLKIPINDKISQYILDQLEWHIPYFIQLLFTTIKNNSNIEKGATETMIDTAIDQLSHADFLNTWYERLVEYNGYQEHAEIILNIISETDLGLSKADLLKIYTQYTEESIFKANTNLSLILNMLEHDGYIMRAAGGLRRFRSPLLKRWWYSKFVE